MTTYLPKDCEKRTLVFDVDTLQEIKRVLSIDTEAGEVHYVDYPLRVEGDHIASSVLRYRSIYPIYGGGHFPCLFHCYGRLK